MTLTGPARERIVSRIREGEVELAKGKPVPEVIRKLGISEQTYCCRRKECGGLRSDQTQRRKSSTTPWTPREAGSHERSLGKVVESVSERGGESGTYLCEGWVWTHTTGEHRIDSPIGPTFIRAQTRFLTPRTQIVGYL